MNNIEIKKLNSIKQLLLNLIFILEKESEDNWIRAVYLMLDKVDNGLSGKVDSKEVIDYVSRTYKSISAGSGSFSDFFIWRENIDDRKKENKKLQKIKDDLWDLLT